MKSVKDEISDVISSLKLTLFLISQIFISSNLEDDGNIIMTITNCNGTFPMLSPQTLLVLSIKRVISYITCALKPTKVP
jgi:hypothetical protein